MASNTVNLSTFKTKGLSAISATVDTSSLLYLKSTSMTAADLGNTVSLSLNATSVSGAANTNHSVFLNIGVGSGLGTPFQLQIPDSSVMYIYKRYYSSNAWSAWSKLAAGNADTWTTARTLTIGNTGKSVDGSANVSWSKDEILGASTSAYFYRGDKTWSNDLVGSLNLQGNLTFSNSGTAFRGINYGTMGDNDQWRIGGAATSSNAGYMEIATADDGTEPIYVRQYTGVFSTLKRTLTLLDGSGDTTLPGRLFIPTDSDVTTNSGTGSIVIGSTSGLSIGIDANEIMCRSSNAASTLYIQNEGGHVQVGSTLTATGTIYSNGGYLKTTCNSKTVTIGCQNSSWCHFTGGPQYYFDQLVRAVGSIGVYNTSHYIDATAVYASRWRTPNLELAELDANRMGLCNHGQGVAKGLNVGSLLVSSAWADASKVPTNGIWCRGSIVVNGANTTGGGIILSDDGDIVDLNDGYCAMRFSYGVRIFSANRGGSATITLASGGNITASALYPSGSPGSNCYFGAGNGDGNGSGTANIVIRSWYGVGFMNGCTAAGTNGAVTAGVDCRSGHIYANAVHNAVWNDYAECRKADIIEGGYCVTETPDGSMMKTTERLQPGCKLTSDTYGSIMGETDEAKTPIAVAGRVLVYPYHNRNDYPLGAAVCSAPNGTIDIMTRDEIIMYPERIVGTVSEIPTYTIWRAGGKDTGKDIEVNGRIWVYVK